MTCEHSLAERETECADGYCPVCLRTELEVANREWTRESGRSIALSVQLEALNGLLFCEECTLRLAGALNRAMDAPTLKDWHTPMAELSRLRAALLEIAEITHDYETTQTEDVRSIARAALAPSGA
jgi:hypothetical protein